MAKIIVEPDMRIPVYQKLSTKIRELQALGMSFQAIAKSMGIDSKTVIKAAHYQAGSKDPNRIT
ncbi:MAG: hypothetical protein HQL19_04520 [Candidatus Omnitrophica bacterium]|nr:hypothetical protein [Candidatus Omnitrophota bacterium]